MKYRLLNIEAWRYPEGWTWNQALPVAECELEDSVVDNNRKLLAYLRQIILSEGSKGRVRVDRYGDIIEVQKKSDGEPICALEPIDY